MAEHRPPWHKLYSTKRWQDLRLKVFLRDLFICRMCGRIEGNSALLVCDHIRPHRGDQRLFWDEANLQTLCKSCHDDVKRNEEQATRHQQGVWD